jgi:hypothetical protein
MHSTVGLQQLNGKTPQIENARSSKIESLLWKENRHVSIDSYLT